MVIDVFVRKRDCTFNTWLCLTIPSLDCKLLRAGCVVPALCFASAKTIYTYWNIRKMNVKAELHSNTMKGNLEPGSVIITEENYGEAFDILHSPLSQIQHIAGYCPLYAESARAGLHPDCSVWICPAT